MNGALQGGGDKVLCKVHVYSAPRAYYHVVRFGDGSGPHVAFEWERDCERKALGDLLELHKNQQFAELNKVIKARKDELGPASLQKFTQFIWKENRQTYHSYFILSFLFY